MNSLILHTILCAYPVRHPCEGRDLRFVIPAKAGIWFLSGEKMYIKTIIILFLLFIFYALGSALYFLVRDKADSTRVVKALTWRIGLSIVLFLLLFLAFAMGWIQPHAIR